MKIKVLYIFVLLVLGCSKGQQTTEDSESASQLKTSQKSGRLISFKASSLRPSPREDFLDTVRMEKIIQKRKQGDTLEIEAEIAFGGCARFDGDAKIRSDSLILSYWVANDTTCATMERYTLSYKILDSLNLDYTISLKYVY